MDRKTYCNNSKQNIYSAWFDHVDEILPEKIAQDSNRKLWARYSEIDINSRGWWGEGGRDTALKRINDGWPDGLLKFQQMMRDMKFQQMMRDIMSLDTIWPDSDIRRRRHKTWSDTGNEVDIHKIYRGQADRAWRSHCFEDSVGCGHKHVTVLVNLAASGATHSDAVLWRGALAAVLCERLQAAGKTVRIVSMGAIQGAYLSREDGDYSVSGVLMKPYEVPLVLEKLAGSFTVAFLRYHIFKAMLSAPDWECSHYMGYPVNDSQAEQILPHPVFEEQERNAATLVMVSTTTGSESARAEMERIKRQLSPAASTTPSTQSSFLN
jgi:hypothetical protein